jgi:hypothetical protein
MADIRVTQTDAREFDVEVGDGEAENNHHVPVPEGLIDELRLPEYNLKR